MEKRNKLELLWVGKDEKIIVEPRILIENPELSNVIYDRGAENLLIHGDNLLALKALQNKYAGKIKFIYIDPPYNTRNIFSTYDDGVEHSIWLNLMRSRLELLQSLLAPEGVIAVQIDNSPNSASQQSPEYPYLFILMDEVFGRDNFISSMVWKKKGNPGNTARFVGTITESILVYAKKKDKCVVNKERFEKKYKYKDSLGEYNLEKFLKTDSGAYKRDTMKFPIVDPLTGIEYLPPEGMRWTFGKETVEKHLKNGLIVFKDESVYFKHYKEGENEKIYNNLLLEHGSLKSAKAELEKLGFGREDFETPKPEILLKTLIDMFSNPGDIILDSFLGSGTTCAVAHKMKRRWIGIELGDHIYSFCKTRMDLIIEGKDKGGISKDVKWTNGGGYRFYELAPSLIKVDSFGEPIINKEYNEDMLVHAVALHEGFKLLNDESTFWKQCKSNENAYLYVTTQYVSIELLKSIELQMGEDEFLIIACKAFDKNCRDYSKKIVIKKIPQMLLGKCEFDINNYNLNVVDIPEYDEEDEEDE